MANPTALINMSKGGMQSAVNTYVASIAQRQQPAAPTYGQSVINNLDKSTQSGLDAYQARQEGINGLLPEGFDYSMSSSNPGSDPNGVDWYAYSQGGPSAADFIGVNPFGSSASSKTPETPQPYAFMDSSLASMFGMDSATAYQEALSNTSYQRAVRDLQAAGLNPVLGISRGASVFQGTADPLAMMSGAGSSSGGSSYGSSGSGKSTANLSGIAKTLSYSAPYLVGGVVGLVTKNPYAAGLAQSATQTLVNLVKYN